MNAKLEPPAGKAEAVKALRRHRARKLGLRFGLCVGLPTLIALIYLGLLATPRYESVASFTVESADSGVSAGLGAMLGAVPGAGAGRDVLVIRDYALSRDMLAHLIAEHGFIEHFRSESADVFSRLPEDASSEDLYDYYLDHVEVEHDNLATILTLEVQAFSADDARRFAQAILDASEAKVNAMDEEVREDRLELFQSEVSLAEERLSAARQAVVGLQHEGDELDPTQSASALMGVRGELEAQLAAARAELQALSANMQPTAPQVVAQRQRVSALQGQVSRQQRRMVDDDGDGLGSSIARFEPAVLEKELAEEAYQSAVSSLEMARIEAARQHRYLSTVSSPSAPNEPTHPVIWRGVLVVFLVSVGVLGIGALLLAAAREHANV